MREEGKKLCVWDLDETLIHCDQDTPEAADVQIEVKFPKKSKHVTKIYNFRLELIFVQD